MSLRVREQRCRGKCRFCAWSKLSGTIFRWCTMKAKSKQKSIYSKKLLNPLWQKKRLKILERDKWICQWCGDKESTLHVHHLIYAEGMDPWKYEDDLLLTICQTCHDKEYKNRVKDEKTLLNSFKVKAFSSSDLFKISSFIFSLPYKNNRRLETEIITDNYVASLKEKLKLLEEEKKRFKGLSESFAGSTDGK